MVVLNTSIKFLKSRFKLWTGQKLYYT